MNAFFEGRGTTLQTTWEYRVIQGAGWHRQLDAAGLEGWEAVGVVPIQAHTTSHAGTQETVNSEFAVLLKRPMD
ncbi:hypothetical protein [Streptomyces sp. NPDC007063]|uniref:hypothetical protein n=1 Tax=Streptomyces sp. NPDC007063 TaxID=3364772 RepID=UPI00368F223E